MLFCNLQHLICHCRLILIVLFIWEACIIIFSNFPLLLKLYVMCLSILSMYMSRDCGKNFVIFLIAYTCSRW
jgi:hypothetical protein